MSDGTTTTGARCEGCGEMGVMTCFECMRQEDDGIRAENARLRERVAALEAAGNAMVDELVYLSDWGGPGSDYVVYSCHACGVEATSLDAIQHDADCNVKAWLAALAQAGEGGAA